MSKYIDAIIDHAVGDAMGVPTEFCSREKLLANPVTKMRISYAGNKGVWSDDTSMVVATIDSFIKNKKFEKAMLNETLNSNELLHKVYEEEKNQNN